MIELYLGSVGSGKSYHALKRGLEKCNTRKGFVVANFPIKSKKKKEMDRWIFMEEFDPQDLIKISFERGSFQNEGLGLLIIDEAGIWFNSRDWHIDPHKRKEWIKFFSQTRKFGFDVVLIVQDERMLDRQIRKLAEYHVKHVKLRNYTFMKLLPWQIFASVRFWQGGAFKGTMSLIFFNPWKAKKYDTMRLFQIDDDLLDIARANGIEVD